RGLAGLLTLDLSFNKIDGPGLAEFVRAGDLRGLGRLLLHNNQITPDGAAAPAAPDLGRLRALRAPAHQIGAAGVRALADSSTLTRLRQLIVYNNGAVSPETRRRVQERFGMHVY